MVDKNKNILKFCRKHVREVSTLSAENPSFLDIVIQLGFPFYSAKFHNLHTISLKREHFY